MKRGFDQDVSDLLQGEFERALYCKRRAESKLTVHHVIHTLASAQGHVMYAYNSTKHALKAQLFRPTLPTYCRYEPKPIIVTVYMFLKKKVGHDVASIIVNMAFRPAKKDLIDAARVVLRRAHPLASTASFRAAQDVLWGDDLIFDILKGGS